MIRALLSRWSSPEYEKPKDWADHLQPVPEAPVAPAAPSEVEQAIRRAQDGLLGLQNREDGYWCGPLRGDTTTTSDTVMLLHFLGRAWCELGQ